MYILSAMRVLLSPLTVFLQIYSDRQCIYLVLNQAILIGEEEVWTSITLLCPVNLPNEEKLAGREKLAHGGSQDKEKLLTNASSPSLRRWTCNS